MTPSIFHDDLREFLVEHEGPRLSLYMPTHRHYPDNLQDPIRYKNLLKTLEESLRSAYSSRDAKPLLAPYRDLAEDRDFWNHTWDGLAVLGTTNLFKVMKLQRPVPELAVASDSFHIKPLLRILQSADRYQVLSLNRHNVKLFEGNRDQLDEVELPAGVPHTITEALGEELTEKSRNFSSHGISHGHHARKDELDIDEDRFFRAIDKAILEAYSKPSGLPLVLAALGQYHTPFHKISRNPYLLDRGIETDAAALTGDQLCQRAWSVVLPEFHARLHKLAEEFGQAKSRGLGSDDVNEVARAAAESRIDAMLVEAERLIPGKLDHQTGKLTLSQLNDPQADDLLDDLAEMVLSRGGHTIVVPAADMPTKSGVAATYRF